MPDNAYVPFPSYSRDAYDRGLATLGKIGKAKISIAYAGGIVTSDEAALICGLSPGDLSTYVEYHHIRTGGFSSFKRIYKLSDIVSLACAYPDTFSRQEIIIITLGVYFEIRQFRQEPDPTEYKPVMQISPKTMLGLLTSKTDTIDKIHYRADIERYREEVSRMLTPVPYEDIRSAIESIPPIPETTENTPDTEAEFSLSNSEVNPLLEGAVIAPTESNSQQSLVPVNVPPSLWAGKSPKGVFDALIKEYDEDLIAYIIDEKCSRTKTDKGRPFLPEGSDPAVYRRNFNKLLEAAKQRYILTFDE